MAGNVVGDGDRSWQFVHGEAHHAAGGGVADGIFRVGGNSIVRVGARDGGADESTTSRIGRGAAAGGRGN